MNTVLAVLTSTGDGRSEGDGEEVRWLDYTGPLEDGWGGVLAMDHPMNSRFPTPVRIHPELPYFSFALVRNAPYTIVGSQPLELRHRFFVHTGRPDSLRAERLAADFADPPLARLMAGPKYTFEEDLS